MPRHGEGGTKVERVSHEKGARNDRGALRKDQNLNYCFLHDVSAVAWISHCNDRNLALFKSSEFFL